jgi:hypothetical protein
MPPAKKNTDEPTHDQQKRLLGQFFTVANPFLVDPFHEWWKSAKADNPKVIEPFAGAANIVRLAGEANVMAPWACYDIQPPANTDIPVIQRDTIRDFPIGFNVAITNPPYLAKNSAARRGLPFPDTHYEDLYQLALDRMLANCSWVAAIIPASFLTQNVMQERLMSVVDLDFRMFDDTDCPVCLVLFGPKAQSDFTVYRGNEKLGSFNNLRRALPRPRKNFPWRFNDPRGEIGLHALDNNREASIRFVPGEEITPDCVSASSRSLTRIKVPVGISAERVIERANKRLMDYRAKTHDIFLTAFKGLRSGGGYRRRLDFAQARMFLDLVAS